MKMSKGARDILDYLKQHGSITHFDAEKKFLETRLAARIYEIRRDLGDNVVITTRVPNKTKKNTHARYVYRGEK